MPLAVTRVKLKAVENVFGQKKIHPGDKNLYSTDLIQPPAHGISELIRRTP